MGAPGSVNITISKCGCGDPVCDQYTLSNQGTVGFTTEDAHQLAASDAMYEALETLLSAVDKMDRRPSNGGGVLPIDKALATGAARSALALARGESQ